MATTAQEYNCGELSLLEARERELERQLAETREEIAAIHARLNMYDSPTEGQRISLNAPLREALIPLAPAEEDLEEEEDTSRPYLMIQPLAPQDPLRAKWQLGSRMPKPDSAPQSALPVSGAPSAPYKSGTLRLIGLMDDGQPWERRIPFAQIARDEGVVLGRDEEFADVIVNESSVSRRHACLEISDEGLVVTDLGSTNGMRIDERLLAPYERQVPLHDGCTLSLGEARILIEIIP